MITIEKFIDSLTNKPHLPVNALFSSVISSYPFLLYCSGTPPSSLPNPYSFLYVTAPWLVLIMEVPQSIRPPRDSYRYWPTGDLVFKGIGTHIQRFIFANQTFTPFEAEKLVRLKAVLQKDGVVIPSYWDDTVLLRLCYGTHWKTRNAVAAVIGHLEWRREMFRGDYKVLFDQVRPLLEGGCLYVHGRDSRYRPCIIMHYPKFNFREVTPTQHTIYEYMPLIGFFLDYVIEYMFLPGQIENWVTITDMGNMSLSDMPISVRDRQHIRKLIEMLTANYRCRLAHNFVINAPTSVSVIWAIVKKFLDKDTVERISLTSKSTDRNLLQSFNPGQLEQRYGGTAPNLTQFWPPIVPDCAFEAPGQVPGALLSRHSSYPLFLSAEASAASEPNHSVLQFEEEKKFDGECQMEFASITEQKEEEQAKIVPPSTKDSTTENPLEQAVVPEPVVTIAYDSGLEVTERDLTVEVANSQIIETKEQRVIIDEPIQASIGCFCGQNNRELPSCAVS